MKQIKKLPKLPKRKAEGHKGSYGRDLIIAGSLGMTGAACLTAESALRAGAGLVTLGIPQSLNFVAEVKLTCVITNPLPETEDWSLSMGARDIILDLAEQADVVAMGPGVGRNEETQELIRALVQTIEKPIVLDADGINALAGRSADVLQNARATVVLTPHPGEMARLVDMSIADIQANREKIAVDFAKQHNCLLVLKGHGTVVTDGELIYVNETGNPGMASGGTGDVLTGMVAGLIPQLPLAFEAAQLAVFLHGLAGDLAAHKLSQFCLTAEDVMDHMGTAFQMFRRGTKSVPTNYVEVEELRTQDQQEPKVETDPAAGGAAEGKKR